VPPPSSTLAADIKRLIDSHPGTDCVVAIYTSLPVNHQTTLLALAEKSVQRPLRVRLCADTARYHNSKDSRFKEHIDRFSQPYSAWYIKVTPFRFMDLPTELRVKIIRYALTTDYKIWFTWLSYSDTSKKGSFYDFWNVTAIRKTCKQLHAESCNVFWEANTLAFSGDRCKNAMDPKTNYDRRQVSDDTLAKEAVIFFVRNMQPVNRLPLAYVFA